MIKVNYSPPSKGLRQVYSYGMLFSLLTAKNEQIFPFVFCADYFNEVFAAIVTKEIKSVYGFSYDPKKDLPPDEKFTRVLISHDSKDLWSLAANALKFLNEFEVKIGLKKSTMNFCAPHPIYKKNVLRINGDKRIRNSVLLLTAWRLVLRNSFAADESLSLEENLRNMAASSSKCFVEADSSLIKKLIKFLDYVCNKDKDFIDYTDEKNFDQPIYQLHGESGLVTFETVFDSKRIYHNNTPWQQRIIQRIS